MTLLHRLASMLQWLFRRDKAEQRLDADVQSFIELSTAEKVERGLSPIEARRRALVEVGGAEQAKELVRSNRHGAVLDELVRDLGYAIRKFLQNPAFTLTVVITLGLGIGANAAIFSMVDAALLRPLPFPESDRLFRIWATKAGAPIGGPSPMDMRDLAAGARSFEGMVAYDRWRKNVSGIAGSKDPEEMVVGLVPGTYFQLLRIRPILGRLFTEEEGVYGNHYVAAISSSFWRSRFAADPQVLGKTLRINSETYTITAVIPDVTPGWMDQTNAPIAIWTPFASENLWTEQSRTARGDLSLGRLKPGVSYEQAGAELSTLAAQLARVHPEDEGVGVAIEPLADTRAGPVRPVLLMLCGAVGVVLIITCANLASLLVARNSARSRELAVRAALGAGRWRLLRQLILETLLLSFAGGAAGVVLAAAGERLLERLAGAQSVPYMDASNVLLQFWSAKSEPRLLLFTLLVSIVTALLFGVAPAFSASRVPLTDALRDSGRGGTAGIGKTHFRRMLVIAEVGLSLVLVFAAALLVQTMMRLQQQEPGFRTDHLLLAHIFIPPTRYPDSEAISRFCETLSERLRALPGVQEASVAAGYPPQITWQQTFTVPGSPSSGREDIPSARFAAVDTHYLKTLGLPLLAGRDFEDNDVSTRLPVAVVNEEFARRYMNGSPIGRSIHPGPPAGIPPVALQDFGSSSRDITVVGMVRNFMNDGPARPPAPQIFSLFRQFPGLNYGFKDIVVRTATNPERLVAAVERELRTLDGDIPLGEIQSMETHMSSQTADTRYITVLLGLFAGLGTLLAVIGTYGVISYLVAQRTRELGVRRALGASSADLLWLVLRSGLFIGLGGVTLGLVAAIFVRRFLAGLLYGVQSTDLTTLTGAALLLLSVVVSASAVPAWRAMRADPLQALRRQS